MTYDILRATVYRTDGDGFYAEAGGRTVRAGYGKDGEYLRRLLKPGMVVNLLGCGEDAPTNPTNPTQGDAASDKSDLSDIPGSLSPALIVVEPDFLLDISSVATCFGGYGYGPLPYTIGRFQARGTSQAMLLGNLAGDILDAMIGNPHFDLAKVLGQSFRSEVLGYCSCPDFDADQFKRDAATQAQNMRGAVAAMFAAGGEDKAVLEPSVVCFPLGLQGRVDMMTTDCRLLVEQKSGRNMPLERDSGHWLEAHYIQLLLYRAVLRLRMPDTTMRSLLLYSRYPAKDGLVDAPLNESALRQAIATRNRIVAGEIHIAKAGFGSLLPLLTVENVYDMRRADTFFRRYIAPRVADAVAPLQWLPELQKLYVCRMLTFAYREQLAAKMGHSPEGRAAADLWRMPFEEKMAGGDILPGLTVRDTPDIDNIIMDVPDYGDDFQPNFRRGDMAWLYAYTGTPDATKALLFKCIVTSIGGGTLRLHLADSQRGRGVFAHPLWALEHAGGGSTTAAITCMRLFATAAPERQRLLMGLDAPRTDTTQTLTQSYHTDYDAIVLAQKQSSDYYLLIGPPGTGKTSMALRYIVEEELAAEGTSVLLTAYTNRAVDEICGMLCKARIDFLRIGSRGSCDPRYTGFLLDEALRHYPTLRDIRRCLTTARVVVATTATLLSRCQLLDVRDFSLCVVDEASQILETGIVGLLAAIGGRFVLVGDHKQLPAVVQQTEGESIVEEPQLQAIGFADCRQSLFERLLRQGKAQVGVLRKQGRMHPDIARLACSMFYQKEGVQPVPLPHQQAERLPYKQPAEDELDECLIGNRVVYIADEWAPHISRTKPTNRTNPTNPTQTDATPDKSDKSDLSDKSPKSSAAEADIVAAVAVRVYRQYGEAFDPDHTLGVIVPYRNQITMIRRRLHALGIPALDTISIDTVERYQGSQRDVIVYSFTVRDADQMAFLTANTFFEDGRPIDRKLNVAITRAREQLVMTGHTPTLMANELFAELIGQAAKFEPGKNKSD